MNTKHKKNDISDEIICIVAEKGLRAARLNKAQTKELFDSRLPEVYALWDMTKKPIKPLEKREIDHFMNRFYPDVAPVATGIPSLTVRLHEATVELIGQVLGWNIGSPVFVCRSAEQKSVVLHREIGRVTIHVEVISRAERLADIRLCLTDESKRDTTSFEVELLKGNKCIEAANATSNETVLFRRVETGEYLLRFLDSKGEIASLRIGME